MSRKCRRCAAESVSGHGRQYCEACAVIRRDETNRAFWVRQRKPMRVCVGCGTDYKPRVGNDKARAYCATCALAVRAAARRQYEVARCGKSRHNVDHARAYAKQYKQQRPEWNRGQSAVYKKRHPEKVREQVNRRRAMLAGAPGRVTVTEFWAKCEQLAWRCSYCPRVLDRTTATMDHVIPLSKGGSNHLENIVPSCRSCNARKGNRVAA